jgi:hypothetical protein
MIKVVPLHGELVCRVADRVWVASKTTTGIWYDVTDGRCQCPGFSYRGTCRHLAVVIPAIGQLREGVERGVDGSAVSRGHGGLRVRGAALASDTGVSSNGAVS